MLSSLPASAQVVTDRLTGSAGASIVAPLVLQVEMGYFASTTDGASSQGLPDALLRFGFAPAWEARAVWTGWTFRDDASGTNDLSVGTKFAVVREQGPSHRRPAVSILGEVSLPVGSAGFSSDSVTVKRRGVFAMPLSGRWALNWNVGPRFDRAEAGEDGGVDIDVLYTATATRTLTVTLSAFAELFGKLTTTVGQRFQTGLTGLVGERVQWDVRFGVGLSAGVPAWTVGAGVSARLPN